MKTDTLSNQLRWVILLLIAAVILPTVCLLWFMNQAVKNERLAVRQKLIDVYREKTAPLIEYLDQKQLEFEQDLEETVNLEPYSFFREYCLERENADGVLIRNRDRLILFPVPIESTDFTDTTLFDQSWKLEFIDNAYIPAARAYESAIKDNSIPTIVFEGKIAMVRCYEKAGEPRNAIEVCKELAYPGPHIVNDYPSSDVVRARLKLVQLYQEYDAAMFEKEATQLLADLVSNAHHKPLASEVRVFVLGELLDLLNQTTDPQKKPNEVVKAIILRDAELLSLEALEAFERQALWDTWQDKQLETIELSETVYGMPFTIDSNTIVFISRRSSTIEVLSYLAGRLSDAAVTVGVFDMHDAAVYGDNKNRSDAFLTLRPGRFFDQWKLCFFFRDATVFDAAASKQTTIYLWTGLLATVLVFAAGAFAIRAVNHQIKMNRLKNDFIATVTHELKTPLASMRLLVDTLLEKRYDNEQTATEYLHMVANENKRLTHLIDSFLTFSRMERNKQVFDFQPISPNAITTEAVEAMQARFSGDTCSFTHSIAENLPAVHADKDAMVTVLVNLLDNAYKYTNSNKQIELKVCQQNGSICFAIKDNGVGLGPRARKKIFNRFYQVDSRLSRRTEGCGLGLSIVKFIVDAHKGTIEVESTVGEGSTFTVRVPHV